MKKLLMVLLIATLVSTGLSLPAATAATIGSGSPYAQSMQRMMDLGIFSATTPDKMNLDGAMTREQLATVIVLLNGQEDKVSMYKNTAMFSDVPASRWSNGYIGAAVKLGYMTSAADGLFHPMSPATFAEISKIFSKLLSYEDFVLTGNYPYNYLNLMTSLGILDGISYTPSGSVSRGQTALMIERLLQTKMFDGAHLFVDTISAYKNMIVLENARINKNSDERRILTDIGVYTTDASLKMPEAGMKYVARMKNGQIVKMALADMEFQDISIKYAVSGKLIANNGQTVYLPSNLTYYYHGAVSNYDAVNASLRTNSSLAIGKKSDGTGYAVVFDPMYSDPRVISTDATPGMLENLYGGMTIDREGKYITSSQIEADDVVYEVTDIWGGYTYVLIYSNHISGEVTAILPNKVSPKTIQVDNVNYTLSPDFPLEKLIGEGSVEVDQGVKLLLDNNGQAVDVIVSGESSNQDYVLVLDGYSSISQEPEDFGKEKYYVTILGSDGIKKTYLTEDEDINEMKGKVATYKVTKLGENEDDLDTAEVTPVPFVETKADRINKEARMVDNSTVTNDAVIFNITANASNIPIEGTVIKWSDIPDGLLESGKLQYMHKTGDFQDIDMIVFNNVLDQNIAYGLVTGIYGIFSSADIPKYNVTVQINGKPYNFTSTSDSIYLGEAIKLTMSKDAVSSVEYAIKAITADNFIDAIDSTRIRINGTTYTYKNGIAIYEKDGSAWKAVGTGTLVKGQNNRLISVYLDKPLEYGGKVVIITIE